MPGVLVLGSSNTDLVIRAGKLPRPGETVMGSDYFQAHGGKGANQAVAAARAGAETTFIASVGDDAFGRASLEHYRAEGLGVGHIKVVPGKPSGVALIVVGGAGENMIAVHPGANAELRPEDIDALPDSAFERHKVFVAQLETPVETVRAGLRRAKRAGMLTILNPAPVGSPMVFHLKPSLLADVDILAPNETEFKSMTGGIPAIGEREIVAGGAELMKKGPKCLIVTQGERGCAVLAAGDRLGREKPIFKMIPAVKAEAVDTVAAGDAFIGALAARLSEMERPHDEAIWDAVRWGCHAAALSVTRRGAQPSLPRREEIEASWGGSSGGGSRVHLSHATIPT